jgi:aspartate aminotransferase
MREVTDRRSIRALRDHAAPFLSFMESAGYVDRPLGPDDNDFVFGNPHDMPLPGVVGALGRHLEPQDPRWFAYKLNERVATVPVAHSLQALTGRAYEAEHVVMTTGAFGALAVSLKALLDAGDEVLYFSPPWFFYALLIAGAGGTPRKLVLSAPRFEPDLDLLRSALSERTRAIIWNDPHNPSGRVHVPQTLAGVASVLREASARYGRPIYAIADEAYRRVLFDGRSFESLAQHYPDTLQVYTYGKTLLMPGQRLGYVALPPSMSERAELRRDLETAQLALGFAFPNALMQYALADLERECIDLAALERRRDRLVPALRDAGYEVISPEGTFYVLVRAPIPDDRAFCRQLATRGTFVLPGATCELPGWFRLSLTATDSMVERALPAFEALAKAR